MTDDDVGEFNTRAWASGDFVRAYSEESISPGEAIMLARHRDALAGPTVELGCGAGRLTRVLAGLSDDVRAFDVSERMVAACRSNVPGATVAVIDLRDLSGLADASATAVLAEATSSTSSATPSGCERSASCTAPGAPAGCRRLRAERMPRARRASRPGRERRGPQPLAALRGDCDTEGVNDWGSRGRA